MKQKQPAVYFVWSNCAALNYNARAGLGSFRLPGFASPKRIKKKVPLVLFHIRANECEKIPIVRKWSINYAEACAMLVIWISFHRHVDFVTHRGCMCVCVPTYSIGTGGSRNGGFDKVSSWPQSIWNQAGAHSSAVVRLTSFVVAVLRRRCCGCDCGCGCGQGNEDIIQCAYNACAAR